MNDTMKATFATCDSEHPRNKGAAGDGDLDSDEDSIDSYTSMPSSADSKLSAEETIARANMLKRLELRMLMSGDSATLTPFTLRSCPAYLNKYGACVSAMVMKELWECGPVVSSRETAEIVEVFVAGDPRDVALEILHRLTPFRVHGRQPPTLVRLHSHTMPTS